MNKNVVHTFYIIIMLTAALALASCSTFTGANKNSDSELKKELDADTYSASSSPVTSSADSSNVPHQLISGNIDYASYIPEVTFGSPLISFNENMGKTFLYADVTFSDVEQYAQEMLKMNFILAESDISKNDDTYTAKFYNADNCLYADIYYSKTGLSIIVYFVTD